MKRCLPGLLLLLVFIGCKKPYNPPALQAINSFLVVDGFINMNQNAVTTITLTRTKTLTDSTSTTIPELFAQVFIEADNGTLYYLQDNSVTGHYSSDNISLPPTGSYRLKIITGNQLEYLSDFVTPQFSPPIDSLTWEQNQDVTIYVNSHDPNNSTHYYKWDFIETWEYHARVENFWGVENGHIFPLDNTTQRYKCWATATSNTINTGTSVALSEDVISHAPITTIIKDNDRIKVRYSILVRQIPLTLEAYNYWVIIQKNSQELGSLFDLQPSQLTGNIHAVTNPGEPVIGFVSAVTTSEKRLFILNRDLIDWSTQVALTRECTEISIPTNNPDIYSYTYPDPDYAPFFYGNTSTLILIIKDCIDCRLRGGTNTPPSFW